MKIRKYIFKVLAVVLILNITIPITASAATSTKYGILIGNAKNYYMLYDDLIVLSPNKKIMVKAYAVCKELGLFYSYDKDLKKLTIMNEDNGKSLICIRDNKTYTYFSSDKDKGIKKTANYQCYYDKENKCNLIHISIMQYLLNYKYFKLTKEDDYYDKGYKGMVVYSKYEKKDEIPSNILTPLTKDPEIEKEKKAKENAIKVDTPTTELTPEIIKRLQNYPIRGEATVAFNERKDDPEYPNYHQEIVDIFLSKIILKIEDNEKLFTNAELTYECSGITELGGPEYRIRTIYQITDEDGTIYEQDWEFGFVYLVPKKNSSKITVPYWKQVLFGTISEVRRIDP